MLTSRTSLWTCVIVSTFFTSISRASLADPGRITLGTKTTARQDVMGGDPFYRWSISIGIFSPDEGRHYDSDSGFSAAIARAFCHSDERTEYLLGFRYSRFTSRFTGGTGGGGNGGGDYELRPNPDNRSSRYFSGGSGADVDVDVFNASVAIRHYPGNQHTFSLGPELGIIHSRGGGKDSTDVSYGLGGSAQFNRFFLDVRFLWASGHSPNALIASGGIKF